MNKFISKIGQAGLMAVMGYEIGHNVGEHETQSIEKIETKVTTRTDNSENENELFYIVVIILVAIIIFTTLRMFMKKSMKREEIQLRQLWGAQEMKWISHAFEIDKIEKRQ